MVGAPVRMIFSWKQNKEESRKKKKKKQKKSKADRVVREISTSDEFIWFILGFFMARRVIVSEGKEVPMGPSLWEGNQSWV